MIVHVYYEYYVPIWRKRHSCGISLMGHSVRSNCAHHVCIYMYVFMCNCQITGIKTFMWIFLMNMNMNSLYCYHTFFCFDFPPGYLSEKTICGWHLKYVSRNPSNWVHGCLRIVNRNHLYLTDDQWYYIHNTLTVSIVVIDGNT